MDVMTSCRSYIPPGGSNAWPPLAARQYCLPGPQVEPGASYWTEPPRVLPGVVSLATLTARTDDPGHPWYFPPYPADPAKVSDEIEELHELASLRDDPEAVVSFESPRRRLGISAFLQLRPPPLGTVFDSQRGAETPVVRTGRELARCFEAETPGLIHRHALNWLLKDVPWSPPRQARVWMALDVTVYSAILAAWHYKWFTARTDVRYRPRPVEVDYRVNVLYNLAVNATGSGDGARRQTPFPSPGTPRHPAYPSGHSVVGGAASEILSFFFPDFTEEFAKLADNAGLARLWAGIHYRSDHEEGVRLGRHVARLVIEQLQGDCVPPLPGVPGAPPNFSAAPPTHDELVAASQDCGSNGPRRDAASPVERAEALASAPAAPVAAAAPTLGAAWASRAANRPGGFRIIRGTFHVTGYSPDGDSIRFRARNRDHWQLLSGPAVGLNGNGHAQLRLEAIDTLETHYRDTHQPLGLAKQALDELLAAVGIRNVVWNAAGTRVTSADDGTEGYIVSRTVEANRRPVAFAFAGTPPEADGSRFFFDAQRLRQSVNFRMLRSGLAYPTYYDGLFSDLRLACTAGSEEARRDGRGVWAVDRTNTGVDVTSLSVITDDEVILPKLFRRLAEYLDGEGSVSGFVDWLRNKQERVLILTPQPHTTHFDTIVEVDGTTVRLTERPENLVFGG